MEKNYSVWCDITMSKRIEVSAENEDEAREKVREMISQDPYEFACNFGAYVSTDIVDVEED